MTELEYDALGLLKEEVRRLIDIYLEALEINRGNWDGTHPDPITIYQHSDAPSPQLMGLAMVDSMLNALTHGDRTEFEAVANGCAHTAHQERLNAAVRRMNHEGVPKGHQQALLDHYGLSIEPSN